MKKSFRVLGAVLAVLVLLFGYAWQVEPRLLITHNVAVASDKANLRIAFFSDTHFGPMYPESNLTRIVQKINAASPDIVIFGGDFVDDYQKDKASLDLDTLEAGLSQIQAKYGKFAVPGNHEYSGRFEDVFERLFTAAGFTVLKGAYVPIPALNVVVDGVDDYYVGNPDTSFPPDPYPDFYHILAAHSPQYVYRQDMSTIDLVVAGHMHGRQVFQWQNVNRYGQKIFYKGLYSLGNERGTQIFVTTGIGLTNVPLRFGNVPEVAVIDVGGG